MQAYTHGRESSTNEKGGSSYILNQHPRHWFLLLNDTCQPPRLVCKDSGWVGLIAPMMTADQPRDNTETGIFKMLSLEPQ